MPVVTEQPITAYAHCVKPRCPGNDQAEVQAIRTETGLTYEDLGGDWPFVERSHISLRFADEADAVCPFCEGPREVTGEPRKQYAPLSGHDPLGLLDIQVNGREFDPSRQIEIQRQPMTDPEREQMLSENADLRERLARLEGFMLGQQEPPLAHEADIEYPGTDEEEAGP